MDTYDFLSTSLALPVNALAYSVSEKLAALFPERAVLEGDLGYCDVEKFAAAGLCSISAKSEVHNQFSAAWDPEYGLWKTARNAWYDVEWHGRTLETLILTWNSGFQEQPFTPQGAVPQKLSGELFGFVELLLAEEHISQAAPTGTQIAGLGV